MKVGSLLTHLAFAIVALSLFLLPLPSGATTVTFDLGNNFPPPLPAGSAPWLTATFDDHGTPGSVTLMMSAVGLTSPNFVDGAADTTTPGLGGWYFNFNPSKDVTSLAFAFGAGSGNDANNVYTGANTYQADGGGWYDIRFQWGSSTANQFKQGDTATYTITAPGLVATDFDFISSSPNIANGQFYSAARVQGIVPTPPSTDTLGFVGADIGRGPRACISSAFWFRSYWTRGAQEEG